MGPPVDINIWKMVAVNLNDEIQGGGIWSMAFCEQEHECFIELYACPATAMDVIKEFFKVYGDDDAYAGITNGLDEIKKNRQDILIVDELVPFGEFEHLYEGV